MCARSRLFGVQERNGASGRGYDQSASPSEPMTFSLPMFDPMNDALRIVTTAVTPVVMVSATAILASGVNTRYLAISDRVRSLSHEFRLPECAPERRRIIALQMRIFQTRISLVSRAARLLYMAAGWFVFVALLISVSLWEMMLQWVTLPAFVAGLLFVAWAIGLQLAELNASHQTITLEAEDVLRSAAAMAAK